MTLRFIVMTTGYAENASTGCLIYQCGYFGNPGYSSYKEAISDLAMDLYAKFYEDHLSSYENRYRADVKKCCRDALILNKEAKFCSECGTQTHDKKFDYQEFMEYVRNLTCTTADSYGSAEWAEERELKWWPYWTIDFIGAAKEEIIFMAENAEVVLLAALLDAKPDLETPCSCDDDCGETDFYSSDWEQFKNETQPSYS